MFDKKLLEELPRLDKFYKMSISGELPKHITDLIDNLKNRSYESVFLSFNEKDINSIIIFGGKPIYDPLYTSIYVKERNYRNLKNFEGCIKLKLKSSSQIVEENYEKIYPIPTDYSYDDKKIKKRITVNFPRIKFKNKKTNNRLKYKGIERKAVKEYFSESLKTEILNYIKDAFPVYTGLTCKEHYKETFDEKNILKSMIKNPPLTNLEKAFWRFADSNSLSTQNIIETKFTDLKFKFKTTEIESFSRKSFDEPNDFNIFDQLYFRNFFDIKYVKNIVLAGGAVFGTLFSREFIDYDIFFHNCNPEIAKYIIDTFITRASTHVQSVRKNENVVTVWLHSIPYFDIYTRKYSYKNSIVQFILRIYNSPSEIIHGFDTDFSCCLYDFYTNSVYVTERFIYAIANGFNTVNLEKLSPSYEYRLLKGFMRGIGIKVPMLKHMLKHLDIGNLQKERGLATILKYLINYYFSDKDKIKHYKKNYLNETINNHDYSGKYSEPYNQSTNLTFNITDPTSQAIGTFNRIIFEDCRNWFTFPNLEIFKIKEHRETKEKEYFEIKTDGFTKYNLNLLECLPKGTKIHGAYARNIYNSTFDKCIIYLTTTKDPRKILKNFFHSYLEKRIDKLKTLVLNFSNKIKNSKESEIINDFFDTMKNRLENDFETYILETNDQIVLDNDVILNEEEEAFPLFCSKHLDDSKIRNLWTEFTDEQKDFIEDIKIIDNMATRYNLRIPNVIIWKEEDIDTNPEISKKVYDKTYNKIYAEITEEGVKFVFDESIKHYIQTKTEPELQSIKNVEFNSNYKLQEDEEIILKETLQNL